MPELVRDGDPHPARHRADGEREHEQLAHRQFRRESYGADQQRGLQRQLQAGNPSHEGNRGGRPSSCRGRPTSASISGIATKATAIDAHGAPTSTQCKGIRVKNARNRTLKKVASTPGWCTRRHARSRRAAPTAVRRRSACTQAAPTRRCRTASKRQMPVATDTLRLSTCPMIGMLARASHRSRVRRRSPAPSAPSTHASGPVRSRSNSDSSGLARRSHQSDAGVPQVVHRPRQVGDGDQRNRLGGPRGRLQRGRRQSHRAVARNDHRLHPCGVGHAEARAEVARVGHAVEQQQQRPGSDVVDHVVEAQRLLEVRGDGHHALVRRSRPPGHAGDPDRRRRPSPSGPPRAAAIAPCGRPGGARRRRGPRSSPAHGAGAH